MAKMPATPLEAAVVSGGIVAVLGVIALSVFPTIGWVIVVTTPILTVLSAAVAATLTLVKGR